MTQEEFCSWFTPIAFCVVFGIMIVAKSLSGDKDSNIVSSDGQVEQQVATVQENSGVISTAKSGKVDFSKADEITICSVNNSNRQRIKNLVDEFGVVKLKDGDQIDFMAYESFFNVDSLVKSSLTSWWNGKYVESTDYKVINQLGDGYFKLECGAYKLYLLYVPA